MSSLPSPADDDAQPSGAFGTLWKFLNQDLRTVVGRKTTDQAAGSRATPPTAAVAPAAPLESLVDRHRIGELRFRREVLEWRDTFHFQVTDTASQARHGLAEQVTRELAELSFLRRRLLTRQASEVLNTHIETRVRSPMRRTVQLEQDALRKRLQAWLPHRPEPVHISILWPKLEWDTRLDLPFNDENRASILTAIEQLTLGKGGIADTHRQWATDYASLILNARHARAHSL